MEVLAALGDFESVDSDLDGVSVATEGDLPDLCCSSEDECEAGDGDIEADEDPGDGCKTPVVLPWPHALHALEPLAACGEPGGVDLSSEAGCS